MASFNNISLYIKRADLYCSKEFICNVFERSNIGIVKDVKFIKKTDGVGREYNGVIVIFERWFMNTIVTKLLDDMASSLDGTTKFIYEYHSGRYWYINVYKHVVLESQTIPAVDPTLPDNERINKLENLVQTMAAQLHYMQLKQEKTERQLMEVEEKQSRYALCNMELRFKLEDKDMEMEWLKQDNEKALQDAKHETIILKGRLERIEIDLARKEEENRKYSLSYQPLTSKMSIDELL
jgi:hypothetical protein